METSLGGAQFEANLQVITIACEHLSVDEKSSPEDRLGEHCNSSVELAANSNNGKIQDLERILYT